MESNHWDSPAGYNKGPLLIILMKLFYLEQPTNLISKKLDDRPPNFIAFLYEMVGKFKGTLSSNVLCRKRYLSED